MSFWATDHATSLTPAILAREDVSLSELLICPDILSDARASLPELQEYLAGHMRELLECALDIGDGRGSAQEQRTSVELCLSNLSLPLLEKLSTLTSLEGTIQWHTISEQTLNALLAILTHLLAKQPTETLAFLKPATDGENAGSQQIIAELVRIIHREPVSDFLITLITLSPKVC